MSPCRSRPLSALGVWIVINTCYYLDTPGGGRPQTPLRLLGTWPLPRHTPSCAPSCDRVWSEAVLQPGLGGAADGWRVCGTAGVAGRWVGHNSHGPPAHARRSKRGQPHRDRGKAGRGDGICAASLALGPEADGAGTTAHRGGGGKSGPGAGEWAGCPLLAKGFTPSYLLHRNLVQGGFSAVGTGFLGGLGSVRDLGVGRQSTFTTPVGLPEAPVQLLQL